MQAVRTGTTNDFATSRLMQRALVLAAVLAVALAARQSALCAEGETQGFMEAAKRHVAEGRIREAAACMTREADSLSHPGDRALVLTELGSTWTGVMEFDEAAKAYKSAAKVANAPSDVRSSTYLAMGQMEFLRGNYEAAMKAMKEADALMPNNIQTIMQIGIMMELVHMDVEALAHYDRVTVLRDNLAVIWIGKARLCNKLGRLADAEAAARKAVALEGNNPYMHVILGETLLLRREYKAAIRSLNTAIGLDPALAKVGVRACACVRACVVCVLCAWCVL